MTSGVSILGVGMTPFVRQNGLDEGHLVRQAVKAVLDDAGVTVDEVDTIVACNVFGPSGMGQAALRETALVGRPIVNVENACASGASGILEASAWIRAGMA